MAVTVPPAGTLVALTVREGDAPIVNGKAAEEPPPGVGVKMLTIAVPALATSAAGIAA